jgi:hypothetical protein
MMVERYFTIDNWNWHGGSDLISSFLRAMLGEW